MKKKFYDLPMDGNVEDIMSKRVSVFIDCIKVLAAQFVLFGHSFSFFGVTFLKDQTYFPYIQNIGVILLFAISGFLFSYVLKKRGGGTHLKSIIRTVLFV